MTENTSIPEKPIEERPIETFINETPHLYKPDNQTLDKIKNLIPKDKILDKERIFLYPKGQELIATTHQIMLNAVSQRRNTDISNYTIQHSEGTMLGFHYDITSNPMECRGKTDKLINDTNELLRSVEATKMIPTPPKK